MKEVSKRDTTAEVLLRNAASTGRLSVFRQFYESFQLMDKTRQDTLLLPNGILTMVVAWVGYPGLMRLERTLTPEKTDGLTWR